MFLFPYLPTPRPSPPPPPPSPPHPPSPPPVLSLSVSLCVSVSPCILCHPPCVSFSLLIGFLYITFNSDIILSVWPLSCLSLTIYISFSGHFCFGIALYVYPVVSLHVPYFFSVTAILVSDPPSLLFSFSFFFPSSPYLSLIF